MNKSVKVMSLILCLFLSVSVLMPSVAFADENDKVNNETQASEESNKKVNNALNLLFSSAEEVDDAIETEKENENEQEYHFGVQRSREVYEENIDIFKTQIVDISKIIFAILVFVSVIGIGLSSIINSQDAKSRAMVAEKFKNIIIGVVIFSIAILIIGLAQKVQNKAINTLYSDVLEEEGQYEAVDESLTSNWLGDIFEAFFKILGRMLEWVIERLIILITDPGNLLKDNPSGDPYDLNSVVFLSQLGNKIDLLAETDGISLTTAPFTADEWERYTYAYILLSSIAVPLMLIAILKIAYDLVINAGNFEKIAMAKKTALRMCTAIIVIVLGPYIFRTILTFFNMLVFLIPLNFKFDLFIEKIDLASGLLSIITTLWWLFIKLKIVLAFVVREIMLTVMYIATPLVMGIWAINEKFKSMQLWLGETLSNAASQFCYAFVFFLAAVVLHGAQSNKFFTLLWMSMMIKLADFFKDSMQGLIGKWGGINETQVAGDLAGKAKSWAGKAVGSTLDTVDEFRIHNGSRALTNALAFGKMMTTGDISGFVGRGKALQKYGKNARSSKMEEMNVYAQLKRNGDIDNAVKRSSSAAELQKMFLELGDYDRGTVDGEENYNKQMDKIKKFANANSSNQHVQTINTAYTSYYDGREGIYNANRMIQRGKNAQKNEIFRGFIKRMEDNKEKEFIYFANNYDIKEKSKRVTVPKSVQENAKKYNRIYANNGIDPNEPPDANGNRKVYTQEEMQRFIPKPHFSLRDPKAYEADLSYVNRAMQGDAYSISPYSISKSVIDRENNANTVSDSKIAGISVGSFNQNRIRETIANETGRTASAVSNEEISERIKGVNDAYNNAVRYVENQKAGGEAGLPDNIKQKNIDKTNHEIETFVNSAVDMFEKGWVDGKSDQLANKADKLLRQMEINGEYDKAKLLRERVNSSIR